MTPRQVFIPTLGLGMLLFAPAAQAAPPLQATARVEGTTVQLGQPVRILLHITNSEGKPDIDVPRADGLQIDPAGSVQATPAILRSMRPLPSGQVPGAKIVESFREMAKALATDPGGMQGIDPRMMQQYQGMLNQGLANVKYDDFTVVYLAQADKLGQVQVPAFTVRSGAETATTEPIALTVTEARPQPWVKVAMSLSNPAPLVGEKVNLYFDLLVLRWPKQVGKPAPYVSQPITNVSLRLPTLEGMAQIQPQQSLEQLVQKRVLSPGQRGYHINNYPGVILLEPEPAPSPTYKPDPKWHRRRLTFPLRVRKAGEVEVPPMRVAGEVYLDIDGKGARRLEGFVAVSEPLKFRVRDLPQKPADYNGTLGPCRLIATASRTEMPAGTPFTLTLREEGQGNLSAVTPPRLEDMPDFADHFVIRAESDNLRSEKVREFTWTLRPRSEAATEVPAISVSWFDSRKETFQRVRSEPIPLKVTPAPAGQAPLDPAPAANEPAAPPQDDGQLVQRPLPNRAVLWGALAIVGVVALAIVFGARRKRGVPRPKIDRVRECRQAIEQARQRLRTGTPTAEEVSAAVQDFLRARLDMPPGEITPDEATQRLLRAGYPVELAERCAEVLRACAALQFAPNAASEGASELAASADRLLSDILTTPPRRPHVAAATEDELTRQRQAALTQ